jgi:hypothetical protein
MRMPTAAVLVLLALAPTNAFADRHGMECFGAPYTFTLKSLSGLTTNCGLYFGDFSLFGFSLFDRRAGATMGDDPPDVHIPPPPQPYKKHLTFLIVDTSRMDGTHDGRDLLRWTATAGVRRYFPVTPSLQPSLQGLAGVAFTSTRPHGPARSQFLAGLGLGLDFEFAHTKTVDFVVRGQCDGFRLSADEAEYFVRCAPGVSVRWGGR